MVPQYEKDNIKFYQGDCLSILQDLAEDSIDSIITDPPYGLSFMGKDWDHGVPGEHFWLEALRVAKPGAHLLAFGGTRTHHRLWCAVEDAGWEIRDCIMWVYGSGFPKSHDVSKAIDREAGAEREIVGTKSAGQSSLRRMSNVDLGYRRHITNSTPENIAITEPATEDARQWSGWGTALKPAWEPICIARKPLEGTVAQNVLKWGTGGINVDECRVSIDPAVDASQIRTMNRSQKSEVNGWGMNQNGGDKPQVVSPVGRWPANLIHDGSEEVVELFPDSLSSVRKSEDVDFPRSTYCLGRTGVTLRGHDDSGSASRFFYCAKASPSDRDGCRHPTMKPTSLMRYLCRLVTPPNGIILDPFMGAGTTGKAAILEGFGFIGIELVQEYCNMARMRIEKLGEEVAPSSP